MAKPYLKPMLLALSASLFLLNAVSAQHVGNDIAAAFLNAHYKFTAKTVANKPIGYDLNKYDSVFILTEIFKMDTCSGSTTYTIDTDIRSRIDRQKLNGPILVLTDSVDGRYACIVLSDLIRLSYGYTFTSRVIFGRTWYETQLYYSKQRKELVVMEETRYWLP